MCLIEHSTCQAFIHRFTRYITNTMFPSVWLPYMLTQLSIFLATWCLWWLDQRFLAPECIEQACLAGISFAGGKVCLDIVDTASVGVHLDCYHFNLREVIITFITRAMWEITRHFSLGGIRSLAQIQLSTSTSRIINQK